MEWTQAQQDAIKANGKNILLSAAAGSGKTAVLIERIKRLIIEDKADIDRFLITTFTNAASAEMKSRLENAIKEELKKENADRAFLKRQLALMPRANISTFHTFSLEVMKRYFYLTDLEPGFKIGDDIEVSIMKNEAADQLFERRFEEDYEAFCAFLEKYSSDRNENRIKANIIALYNEMRSIPSYMEWAERTAQLLNTDSPCRELGLLDFIVSETAEELKAAHGLYEKAAQVIEDAGIESLYEKAVQDCERISDFTESLDGRPYDENLIESCRAFLSGIKFNQMRASTDEKEAYAQIRDKVTDLRKKGKKILDDLCKKYYARTLEEYDAELREGYEDTIYMTGLIREFESIFKEKKMERNIVDFDDVMHYAIEILDDDKAAAEYREKFRYIFIDEFQDSNMLQEAVIERIAGEDSLFMVGDVKQSIYKFRLAEPEIFKRKYALYAEESETRSMKIDLNSNFRSKQSVTQTVNRVFSAVMEGYDRNAELVCTIDEQYPGMESRLHIAAADEEQPGGAFHDEQREERLVSELIRDSLGREIYDVKRGVFRKAEYRDIVVLSRSRASIGSMEKFLNNEGIPAYGENTGGYFETVEVGVFVNLLKVIDNTRQDIPLISVMRCPIFEFDVREMAAVRIAYREGSFYEAVRQYSREGSDDKLKKRIQDMLDRIAYWKALKNTVPLEELVRVLLYDTGYYDYCSGLPVGKQRVSNLRLLVEKAAQFEKNNHTGLYGFLSYIEAMKNSSISVGEARTLGENENVVRVMTVHKSKGLEFPIVIIMGMGRMIRPKGIGNSAAMHKDLAIGMPHVNTKEKWHRKTLLQRIIEARKAKEELEEEIRILYVAMTRAKDQLLLAGTVKDVEKLEEITGTGRSFLEMVYGPMKEAGESIIVHRGSDEDIPAPESIKTRARIADVFAESRNAADDEKKQLIDERLSFVYPYEGMAAVKSKYSVTELNRRENTDESFEAAKVKFARPEFSAGEKRMTAAQAGTLMHLVMEKTDFREAAARGREYISEVVEALKADGTLTEKEADVIRIENIEAFFEDEVGRRAAASENLNREREFILSMDIDGTSTIVQGIIDCYFEEEDGIVLIDYKNSYIGIGQGEGDIVERYRNQIRIYREALESAVHKPVKEAYLYLFTLKRFVSVKI